MAMVRQLGVPTFFLTFSSSGTWWSELIVSLHYEKHSEILSFDDVANMAWKEKVLLIRENPIATARHFDFRLGLCGLEIGFVTIVYVLGIEFWFWGLSLKIWF